MLSVYLSDIKLYRMSKWKIFDNKTKSKLLIESTKDVFTSVPPPLNPPGGEVRAEMTKTRLYLPLPSLTLVDIFNIISYEFEEELYIDFSIY